MNELQRIDKWLWHARFFKSRSLAKRQCANGRIRINRAIARKPSVAVKVGDILTFSQGSSVRVIKVMAMADRRQQAPKAALLYDDLSCANVINTHAVPKTQHGPRPTKSNRRAIERFLSCGVRKRSSRETIS